jgi:hypothetical protein
MPEAWVALYTPTCLVTGQIDPGSRRLSDHLNDRTASFVSVDNVTYYDLLSDDANGSKSVSLTLRKEAVQLVVPEDRPDPLRPRVRTNALPMVLGFEGFHVRGHLHRQPGDSTRLVELFSNAATRAFFPVADAEIRYLFNSRFDADVPLALVNTKQLQFWALEGED